MRTGRETRGIVHSRMRWVTIQPSSIGTVTKPPVTMEEKLNKSLMVVTQWKGCHENDETASVRRMRCRVVNQASLKQVVASIVTGLQVTMLNPWRGRPHVFLSQHPVHCAQMSKKSLLLVSDSAFIMTRRHSPFDIKQERRVITPIT